MIDGMSIIDFVKDRTKILFSPLRGKSRPKKFNIHRYKQSLYKLYDKNKTGMVVLKNAIPKDLLMMMSKRTFSNLSSFEVKREKYIENNQNVLLLYRGKFPGDDIDNKTLKEVVEIYKDLRQEALKDKQYSDGDILEIKIIHYPESRLGVALHRDLSSNINLIAFFNIFGSTEISICDDKEFKNEKKILLEAGDINLMRAPLSKNEEDIRPLHGIGPVDRTRYVLVIREISQTQEEETNPGNWRGF